MKISEQWLREWANPHTDTDGLAVLLTMGGLEVEGADSPCASLLEGVVVGRVLHKERHPDADRLSVCRVDIGAGDPVQIVCGAPNVQADRCYPVATVGAVLPGGLKIKRTKLRGMESCGMLCSASELGLAEVGEGLLELGPEATVGESLVQLLRLDDWILDINITPNRADCFSVLGLGRDLAALARVPLKTPEFVKIAASCSDTVKTEVAAPAACPVLATRVIRDLDPVACTPLWLAERLRRAGIRPLHPIVDVTNYVMLELGQPMHAYDLDRLDGSQLTVRFATPGECLHSLDGTTLTLDPDVLVIADASGPVAMAGIVGGAATAVQSQTATAVLESACFLPAALAGRARRFGLHTESALRFERGVDFAGQQRALERATALIQTIAGGVAGPVVINCSDAHLPVREKILLRATRLQRLLGHQVPGSEVEAILQRLELNFATVAEGWWVEPASARFDIAIEADLIEEVARVYGYDRLPEVCERPSQKLGRATETAVPLRRVREWLAARGYQEAITYSFVEPGQQQLLLGESTEIALSNPLSADMAVMRRSLWAGLLAVWAANRSRQQERVRLFESGVIFTSQDNEIEEKNMISGLLSGSSVPLHWSDAGAVPEDADLFDIKADVQALLQLTGASDEFIWEAGEHPALRPGRTACIKRAEQTVGWIGELHPRLVRHWDSGPAPLLFELECQAVFAAAIPTAQPVSRFPSVRRDIAVVVAEDITSADLLAAARGVAGKRLIDIMVFDVYRGDRIESGLKSVALGLILQETSRTLTELEIDRTVAAVKERISSQFNASIRE